MPGAPWRPVAPSRAPARPRFLALIAPDRHAHPHRRCLLDRSTLLACGRFIRRPWPPTPRPGCATTRRASRWSRSIPATTRCPENAWRWDQRTPDGFVFNIKAFRLFTSHQTPLSALPADIRAELDGWPAPFLYYNDVPGELRDELWRRYTLALEPLRLPGKLGAVHFQFPPWIRRDARATRRWPRRRGAWTSI